MRILTICPSIYPNKLEKMLKIFELTKSKHTDIIFSDKGTVTEAINTIFNENLGYDYYHITNDETEYQTPLWDLKLAKKGKITYGNDLFQGENLCTFPMIDGDIARAVGWLQLPTLTRYGGDVVWKFIGERLRILEYVPDVVIEHLWEGCADPQTNLEDMKRFAEWLPSSFRDIGKIKEALCQKNTMQ